MNKWKDAIQKDLWVFLLDILAVNLSYFLALVIRFYVGGELRPVAVERYLPAWEGFTPWYTILSIAVFIFFHLYGGLWRYAGINDMNRIIIANLCTLVVHIIGSTLFFTRMSWTYYLIGGLLQFFFIVCIRFGYRVLMVEKRKLKSGNQINTVVVGSGENGRRVVKALEESEIYRPVAVLGNETGTMDGIPVTKVFSLENIGAVFVADPLLPMDQREDIKERSEKEHVEFHDYTGYFSNLGGRLSLTELLSTIRGPVGIILEEKEKSFEDGSAALRALPDQYEIISIEGNVKIRLKQGRETDKDDALAQAYAAVMGDDLPNRRVGQ